MWKRGVAYRNSADINDKNKSVNKLKFGERVQADAGHDDGAWITVCNPNSQAETGLEPKLWLPVVTERTVLLKPVKKVAEELEHAKSATIDHKKKEYRKGRTPQFVCVDPSTDGVAYYNKRSSIDKCDPNVVQPCQKGAVVNDARSECNVCPSKRYQNASGKCAPCPLVGATCDNGKLCAKDGFWSSDTEAFGPDSDIRLCLTEGNTSCVAAGKSSGGNNCSTSHIPAEAYSCAPGHQGVLCASCQQPAYYFKRGRCINCKGSAFISSNTKTALIALSIALVVFVVARLCAKQKAKKILAMRGHFL